MNNIHVRLADWFNEHDRMQLQRIRKTVFIEEQNVPVELEWDKFDEVATHMMVVDKTTHIIIGVGRMFKVGDKITIGRMAVLIEKRNQGLGSVLFAALLAQAKTMQAKSIELSAQTHAIGFYQKLGFSVYGDEFLDAGIPHCTMRYTDND